MKKILILFLFVIAINRQLNAQSFDKTNVATYYFNVNIPQDINIQTSKPLIDSFYTIVQSVLKDSASIQLHELDYLKGTVSYMFGAPMGSSGKATKSNKASDYLRLEMQFSNSGITSTKESGGATWGLGIGSLDKESSGHIKLVLKCELYDSSATMIKKAEVKYISPEKIQLSRKSTEFGNFSFSKDNEDIKKIVIIRPLIEQAVAQLAAQLR